MCGVCTCVCGVYCVPLHLSTKDLVHTQTRSTMNNDRSQHPQPKPLPKGIVLKPILMQGLFIRSTIRQRQDHRLSVLALVVFINLCTMEHYGLRITQHSFREFMLSLSKNKVDYYFQGLLDRGLVSTYLERKIVCYVVTDLGQALLYDINEDYESFTRRLFGV